MTDQMRIIKQMSAQTGICDSQAKKMYRLANRIIDGIGKQYMVSLMENDKRITALKKNKQDAVAQKKYLSLSIIERQILQRTRELQIEEASKRLYELCEKGEVDGYLEKEDHDNLEQYNARLFILLDALDSVANDIRAVYESYALTPDELYIERFLKDTRRKLGEWMGSHKVHDTQYEETVRQEGDKIYELACYRQEVMFRKIDRIRKREEKREEAKHDNER